MTRPGRRNFVWLAVASVMMAGGQSIFRVCADSPASGPAGGAPTGTAPQPAQRPQYWFGVAVENLPPTIAKQLKLKPDQGLLVIAVMPNSPAERAGLKAEDLLIELDGVPLTSQEDLARAANAPAALAAPTGGEAGPIQTGMKMSRITYLRGGDPATLAITPSPRPESMLVMGASRQNFQRPAVDDSPGRASDGGKAAERNRQAPPARNIVLPNGTTAQVGPGYTWNLAGSEPEGITARSIKRLVSSGKTVILSQDTDAAGAVRNTITVEGQSYAVEKGKVESLPPDLQPLARDLLATSPGVGDAGASVPSATPLEQRISDLEKQNVQLREELRELIGLLKSSHDKK